MEWNRGFEGKCIPIPVGMNTLEAVNTPDLLFSVKENSGVRPRIKAPEQMSLRRSLIFGSSGPDVDPSVHHLLFHVSACNAQPHRKVRVTEGWQCLQCECVCDCRAFSFALFSLSFTVSSSSLWVTHTLSPDWTLDPSLIHSHLASYNYLSCFSTLLAFSPSIFNLHGNRTKL